MKDALSEVLGDTGSVSLYMRPENRPGASEAKKTVSVSLPGGTRLLWSAEDPQANILKGWLRSRGYTDEGIETHELYYLGMDVYWPYYEFDDLVYWQSRSRINKRFEFPDLYEYDNEDNITGKMEGGRADYLYGFDDIEPARYVIITESIFDQNTLGEQVLASGGASLSPNQVKKIKLLGPKERIILSPDNDIAGKKSIIENQLLLRNLRFPIWFSLPPSIPYKKDGKNMVIKDWNECITELKLTLSEVRRLYDRQLKKLTVDDLVRFRSEVQEAKKRDGR